MDFIVRISRQKCYVLLKPQKIDINSLTLLNIIALRVTIRNFVQNFTRFPLLFIQLILSLIRVSLFSLFLIALKLLLMVPPPFVDLGTPNIQPFSNGCCLSCSPVRITIILPHQELLLLVCHTSSSRDPPLGSLVCDTYLITYLVDFMVHFLLLFRFFLIWQFQILWHLLIIHYFGLVTWRDLPRYLDHGLLITP